MCTYRPLSSQLCVSGYLRPLVKEFRLDIPDHVQRRIEEFLYEPIEIHVHDGSGNAYTLTYPESPHFFYRGTRPIESSSGMYSGGPDVRYNVESEAEALEWKRLVELVLNDEPNQTQQRRKGAWTVQMGGRRCVIQKGDHFNTMKAVLISIKQTDPSQRRYDGPTQSSTDEDEFECFLDSGDLNMNF